jgi:asparagine synthase (glutamine-hydrolysing)
LLERLYPYLARSPVAQRAMTRQFFGQRLENRESPGFGHDVRWTSTAALKRLFAPAMSDALTSVNSVQALLESLPSAFGRWSPLAQDQHIEVRTLLGAYLLSSQGDRMLMAHSVEGRFPFLDRNVAALAESLPAAYKLRVLDEKHVLKCAARDLVPASILARKKQPYRAPDALSFAGPESSEWIEEVASVKALEEAGAFSAPAARRLIEKCRLRAAEGQLSNADNMGLVGVLSTQLVYHQLLKRQPASPAPTSIKTAVDALERDARAV